MTPSIRCPKCGRQILLLDWQRPERWGGSLCVICHNKQIKTERKQSVDRWAPRPTMKCRPVVEPEDLPCASKTVTKN